MSRKLKACFRAYRCFHKAIEKTGYLSLSSIVESQYYYPRDYPLQPKRNEVLLDTDMNNFVPMSKREKGILISRFKKP